MRARLIGLAAMAVVLAAAGAGLAVADPADPTATAAGATAVSAFQAGCGSADAAFSGAVRVTTAQGVVVGARDGGTVAFKAIPYAAPPVGARRWAPPAPPECWDGERPATAFGPACPQLDGGRVAGDEDCLTLNVWTPAAAGDAARPVLVWLHGGANLIGSASQQRLGTYIYDGARLAERGGAVVVTLNYRLGPLGFLAMPAEVTPGIGGNQAILDQIAALRWVQQQIGAFGGDPRRVLVFGESAGAVDTCVLLASPLAAGLFSAAAMQSGSCIQPPLAQREARGRELAARTGCTTAADPGACLRALPVADLLTALPTRANPVLEGMPEWGPAVDGVVLRESPLAALAAGRHNRVPVVVGANADETGQVAPRIESAAAYDALVRERFPLLAEVLLAAYPAAAFPSPRAAFVALTTDARFVCPARAVARAAAAGQREPVFRYVFTQALESGPGRVFGAFHGLDVLFLFQQLTLGGYQPSADERAVAGAFAGYWTNLAATGDPNGAGLPAWPRYDARTDPYLHLGTPVEARAGYRGDRCDLWDRLRGEATASLSQASGGW